MTSDAYAYNLARTDRWRCALYDAVEPCPGCAQLVLLTSRGSPWDLSAHDARIVAGLRGIDPIDQTLGEGISRPHACPRPVSRPPPPFDSEAGGASRWESFVNTWAVGVAKRAKERRGLSPVLTCRELDAVLPGR